MALQFELRQTQIPAHHSSVWTVFKRRYYVCQPAQKSFSRQEESETRSVKSQKGVFCKGFGGVRAGERKKIARKHIWEKKLAIDL